MVVPFCLGFLFHLHDFNDRRAVGDEGDAKSVRRVERRNNDVLAGERLVEVVDNKGRVGVVLDGIAHGTVGFEAEEFNLVGVGIGVGNVDAGPLDKDLVVAFGSSGDAVVVEFRRLHAGSFHLDNFSGLSSVELRWILGDSMHFASTFSSGRLGKEWCPPHGRTVLIICIQRAVCYIEASPKADPHPEPDQEA